MPNYTFIVLLLAIMRDQIRYILVFLLLLLTQNEKLHAQIVKLDSLNGLCLESKFHVGSVYPHKSSVTYVLDKNLIGFDVTLTTQSKGRHMWEKLFRNPSYGIGYHYFDLGNREILGHLHAVYGLIDIPFHIPKGNVMFSYQVDFGMGYFTKTYDPYKNPLNHVVSSPYNVYIGLDFGARFRLNDQNELKTALELTHCSNGKTRSPNQGLNTISLTAAYLYSIRKPYKPKEVEVFTNYRRHFLELVGNVGAKRDDNLKDDVYLVSSLIADYYYGYSAKYALGIGLDGFYDASLAPHQDFFEEVERDNSVNYQLGTHLGFRARYKDLYILLNAGYYLVQKYLRHGKIYSRIGLRYAITDQVLLNLTLKAHSTIADYIEWGVGYRFNTYGR